MIDIDKFVYYVMTEKKEPIFATDDIFEGLKHLRDQPAGYKLIRSEDGATLAYTTGFKQPPQYMVGGK